MTKEQEIELINHIKQKYNGRFIFLYPFENGTRILVNGTTPSEVYNVIQGVAKGYYLNSKSIEFLK